MLTYQCCLLYDSQLCVSFKQFKTGFGFNRLHVVSISPQIMASLSETNLQSTKETKAINNIFSKEKYLFQKGN